MDDIERTLTKVIDHFVFLQAWNRLSEGARKPSKVFPIILELDGGLKTLKHFERNHPLQELAREIRSSFATREFRSILLAAFNWRSSTQRAKPSKQTALVASRKSILNRTARVFPGNSISKKAALPPSAAEQIARDLEFKKRFVRDFMAFLDSIPAKAIRKIREPREHVDIYRAGRRLYGSYGSAQ